MSRKLFRATILSVCLLAIGSAVFTSSVHAGGGAVIGGNANYAGSGSGYGGQQAPFYGTNSWIFYKNTCDKNDKADGDGGCEDEANWMLFTPDSDVNGNSNWNWIEPECYAHKGGGFWHFGNDAFSGWYSYNGYNHYGLLQYVQWLDNSWAGSWQDDDGEWHWYRYSADLAKNNTRGYGHFYSYDYTGNSNDRHNWYNSSWQLTQKLYDSDEVKYIADHYEDSSDTETDPAKSNNALTQFVQAYKYFYDVNEYPYKNKDGSYRFPNSNEQGGNVWYFCWWPGMVTSTFQGKATVKIGSKSKTTNYVSKKKAANLYYTTACDNDGCNATFSFNLKRVTDGSATTAYRVQRKAATQRSFSDKDKGAFNYDSWSSEDKDGKKLRSGSDKPGTGNKNPSTFSYSEKVGYGGAVCYRMGFKKESSAASYTYVTACAVAPVKLTVHAMHGTKCEEEFKEDGYPKSFYKINQASGNSFTVDALDYFPENPDENETEYGFREWTSGSSCTLAQDDKTKCTKTNITGSTDINVCYKLVHLIANAICPNGASFTQIGETGSGVSKLKRTGTGATPNKAFAGVTRHTLSGDVASSHSFVGWRNSPGKIGDGYVNSTDKDANPHISSSGNSIYKKISNDTNVYAVYGPKVTLKMVAIDMENRNTTLTKCKPDLDSVTVNYNTTASIEAKDCRAEGYSLAGWATSRNGDISSANDDRKYTVDNFIGTDTGCDSTTTTVYAVYVKNKVLSGVAIEVDDDGKYLGTLGSKYNPNSVTVPHGNSATIERKNDSDLFYGYTLRGWRENRDSGSLTESDSYTVNSLTENKTVYVAYIKNEFEGRVQASQNNTTDSDHRVDSGWVLGKDFPDSGKPISTVTVDCSNNDTCTANFIFSLHAVHGFGGVQWKIQERKGVNGAWTDVNRIGYLGPTSLNNDESKDVSDFLYDLDPGETICYRMIYSQYTIDSAPSDQKSRKVSACAYARPRVTLSGIPIDYEDRSKDLTQCAKPDSVTVNWNNDATIYRKTCDGYTFKGWVENRNDTPSGGDSFTAYGLKADKTVYAVYIRNHFAGRAYVTNNSITASTGYIDSNSEYDSNGTITKSSEIECVNDGCDVDYIVNLKTLAGSGETTFTTNTVPLKNSPIAPSRIGEIVGSLVSKTLYPGETLCRQIKFKPYGSLSNTAQRIAKACMTAKVSTFEGKTTVSGAASETTGWKNIDTSKRVNIEKCDSKKGCKVKFEHEMKRISGIGSTTYQVDRESNLIESTRKVTAGPMVTVRTFDIGDDINDNNKAHLVRDSGEVTLYPGMVVCEKLTFKPNNNTVSVATKVYTRVCVSALGDAQPDDPPEPNNPDDPDGDDNGDAVSDALIDIEVRNKSVNLYKTYRPKVYAKPTDTINYRASYSPYLQYTYYLKPEKMQINGGTIYNGSSYTLGTLFNSRNGCSSNVNNCWNNAYGLSSNSLSGSKFNYTKQYNLGDFSNLPKREILDDYTIAASNVGRELIETAEFNTGIKVDRNGNYLSSNRKTDARTTANQVRFTSGADNNNLGNVITTPNPKDKAIVAVPYNFRTGAKVTDESTKEVFAGEDAEFSLKYIILRKGNSKTINVNPEAGKEEYATSVEDARWKLQYCIDDNKCENRSTFSPNGETEEEKPNGASTLNVSESEMWNEKKEISGSINMYMPDMNAGKKICIRVAVWPKDSGSDVNMRTDYYNRNDPSSWSYSDPACFTIHKRPNLQILGGNVYSNGNINTKLSIKRVLMSDSGNWDGVWNAITDRSYDKVVDNDNNKRYIFGSWGELGVISTGTVNGLASGAAISTEPNNTNIRSNILLTCPLSFANTSCSGSNIVSGAIGGSSATSKASSDKSAILKKFTPDADKITKITNGGEVTLSPGSNNGSFNDGKFYYVSNGNITINGSTLGKRTIHVVRADNHTVTIAGNIEYEGGYNSFGDMTKLVVYAKTIIVKCDANNPVTRIDGILIADTVKTCSSDDVDSKDNAFPLKINGAVITGELIPKRTYGAATGNNSGVPAEIINFDPSLYRWDAETTEGATDVSSKLEAVQTRELAPRL